MKGLNNLFKNIMGLFVTELMSSNLRINKIQEIYRFTRQNRNFSESLSVVKYTYQYRLTMRLDNI